MHIAIDQPAAADRFFVAVRRTFEQLAVFPRSGREWETDRPHLAGVRVSGVSRFRNYLIFYRPLADGIEVLTVVHGARNLRAVLNDLPDDEAEELD